MDSFEIVFRPSVHKDLRRLPKIAVVRLLARIEGLATDPWPPRVVKLSDAERLYRIRVGEYRVVYELVRAELVVVVQYEDAVFGAMNVDLDAVSAHVDGSGVALERVLGGPAHSAAVEDERMAGTSSGHEAGALHSALR